MASNEKPLKGYTVLVTRAPDQAHLFSEKIIAAGGCPVEIPLIATRKTSTDDHIADLLKKLTKDDWIVFTSVNGVRYFLEHLHTLHIPLNDVQNVNVACVGEKTKKAAEREGFLVSFYPKEFRAEALAEKLVKRAQQKSKIVIARGNLARPYLREELFNKGFHCLDFIVYETIPLRNKEDELANKILGKKVDFITFTSTSTVSAFMEMVKKHKLENALQGIVFVCIGPVTRDAFLSYQISCTCLTPAIYTIDGMVEEMCAFIMKGRN